MFLAVLLGAVGVFYGLIRMWRRANDPEQKERKRRLSVNRSGRTASGVVVDIVDDGVGHLIHYTYRIGAVDYNACQDVSGIGEFVGQDPSVIVGAVQVKYQKSNPYNSIVICEEWSGLRRRPPKPPPPPI
ncbi:MAG: hypothetical protein R2748_23480 [Bryobacterales bacterium]